MKNKQLLEQFKQFRKWLKENESGNSEENPTNIDYAKEKQAYRNEKYEDGWVNFSVTVPKQAANFLKEQLKSYKKNHPTLWTTDNDKENEKSED